MAKIYKAEMYIIDYGDSYSSLNEITDYVRDRLDVMIESFNVEEREIEWGDDIDINYINCPVETYRKYFKK